MRAEPTGAIRRGRRRPARARRVALRRPRWLEDQRIWQKASKQVAALQLSRLRVRVLGSLRGYDRDKFGPAWDDVDRNGCDTRNDILRRDLTKIVVEPGSRCVVLRGRLRDPYTGRIIAFVRGVKTSTEVQIDHVVALADAWETGAARWTPTRRLDYANDPTVLLAVDGPENESKGDDDASG